MAMQARVVKSVTVGGKTLSQSITETGEKVVIFEDSVAAGEAGELTTRTDNDTGVVTVDDSAHGFSEDDRVDIYWAGGERRGMLVSSVVGNAITIGTDGGDIGSGDDLPTQGTDIVIVAPQEIATNILGTNVVAIAIYSTKRGQIVFEDDGQTEALAVTVGPACVYEWSESCGVDNPITGDTIEKIYVSHGDSSAVRMVVAVLHDS